MTMASRPRSFIDVSIDENNVGRIVFELFTDKTPKTCENFLTLCTNSKPKITYKEATFHRIIDEFMIQGGDITENNGIGGKSIWGNDFDDENLFWREIDSPYLLCMANRGPNTNNSQFFITLEECPHLNGKHTVFGHVVAGKDIVDRIAKTPVDDKDCPKVPVTISHSGELERRKKSTKASSTSLKPPSQLPSNASTAPTSPDRGRRKRRHSTSESLSQGTSRSTSDPNEPHQSHTHRHRRQRSDLDHHHPKASISPDPPRAKDSPPRPAAAAAASARQQHSPLRREGPASHRRSRNVDHTLRGRPRHSTAEEDEASRKRRTSPSRPRSKSPDYRRQRSLPNQYERYKRKARERRGGAGGGGDEDGKDGVKDKRDYRRQYDRDRKGRRDEDSQHGRLGGYNDAATWTF